jgi:hypothetical protein
MFLGIVTDVSMRALPVISISLPTADLEEMAAASEGKARTSSHASFTSGSGAGDDAAAAADKDKESSVTKAASCHRKVFNFIFFLLIHQVDAIPLLHDRLHDNNHKISTGYKQGFYNPRQNTAQKFT